MYNYFPLLKYVNNNNNNNNNNKMKKYILYILISLLCNVTLAKTEKTVTILTYHSISDKKNSMSTKISTFTNQIDYLISKKVNFISSKDLVDAILNKKELPINTVVITFDDGWKSQNLAMSYLNQKDIPATFGLVTQFQKVNSPICLQKIDFQNFQKSKFIYVNHSFTHNVKDYLVHPEADLIKTELELNDLKKYNIDIEPFYIYPYGKKNNLLINSIKNHHYIAAFGVDSTKFSTTNVNIYNIPRFLVNESTDITKIIQ